MTATRLDILIEARNKASAEVKRLTRDIKELNGAGKGGGGGLSREFDELKSRALGANEAMGLLGKGAVGVAVAIGAIQLGQAAFDLGRLGSQSLAVAAAFETLTRRAGESSAEMLSALREASGGTIADSQLMLAANRAMVSGVADSTEEITQLLEIARNQAKFFGLTTETAFSDLVLGLARGEAEIIDNLGIVVKAGEEYERYAQSIGKTALQLSATERTAALTNAVLREGGKLLDANAGQGDNLADSFQRMDVAIQNAKEALGVLFTPAAAAVATQLAAAVEQVTAAMTATTQTPLEQTIDAQITKMQDLERTVAQLEGSLALAVPGTQRYEELTLALESANSAYNSQRALVDALSNAQGTAVASGDRLGQTMNAMADGAQTAAEAQLEAARASSELAAQQAYLRGEILGTVGTMRELVGVAESARSSLRSSFLGAVDALGGAAALEGYRKASQELDGMLEFADAMGYEADEFAFGLESWVQGIRDSNSELSRTQKELTSVGSGVNKAEQAFESLKGKISGILSGALQSGIDLDGILGRQDAIEEPARRLADIAVNGFNSPWAKYFQEQFPQLYEQLATSGDPRGAAAGILREFEAGLRPELLDRETAKQRVRQLLLGESNIEGLAASIAQELAGEFGNQFSQAQILQTAQQALGQGATAGGLDISSGLNAAPGSAMKLLGQVEAQFASDNAVNKAKAIGASVARYLFNGYDEAAEDLPWWDRILAIILRQQVEAGA